ncbi:hypothetical protein [Maricaulis sp.]|uniref:hypothetical protein n=1 Tax=Maricaulis sp. TaxID=1486257 RepID=UPI0026172D4B|nr:hypothetical protein [Maricaulis sp.]
MRTDFKITSPNQLRSFDRALFDYLKEVYERPVSPSVRVEGRVEGDATVKTIDCNCPKIARELAASIAKALARRHAPGF